jgi:CheY-like chemotaxis protein
MSTSTVVPEDTRAKAARSQQADGGGIDRRRRRRAKITAQVHVRAANFPDGFEEVCATVDVSRDGLLFHARQPGYTRGQRIDVTFPYSAVPGALNQSQPAEVVRVTQQQDGKVAVAIEFVNVRTEARGERKSFASGAGSKTAPGGQQAAQSVVLALDSDARTAETMRNVLSQDGYTVVAVSTAREALEFLRNNVPDVLIAEVERGDISGHELCAIIKRNQRLQGVPVILITRAAQTADYAASHQMGAVVCTVKPFQPERLAHVVRLVAPPPTVQSFYGARVAGGR